MTPEVFAQILALGRETRNVEFKGPGPMQRNTDLTLKVIRAVMGLANTPDGGHVFIGVEEDAAGVPSVGGGLVPADLATWTQDDLGALVANHADPRVAFHVLPAISHNGALVLPIRVDEFGEAPVVCVRDGQAGHKQILKEGAVYVRGTGRIETRAVDSYAEMRSLLDLAVSKGLRRFVEQAHGAGMRVGPPGPTDAQRFAEEAAAFPTAAPLEAMRDQGPWRFVVRPTAFDENAVPDVAALERAVRDNVVVLRGWDWPHVDVHARVQRREHHVFQITDMQERSEAWCMFRSGQFIYERPLKPPRHEGAGRALHYQDTINTLTEAFAFAARLAVLPPFSTLRVDVEAHCLDGRVLTASDHVLRRPTRYTASGTDPFTFSWSGVREDLIANWQALALDAGVNLFHRFGLDVGPAILQGFQQNLLSRR